MIYLIIYLLKDGHVTCVGIRRAYFGSVLLTDFRWINATFNYGFCIGCIYSVFTFGSTSFIVRNYHNR